MSKFGVPEMILFVTEHTDAKVRAVGRRWLDLRKKTARWCSRVGVLERENQRLSAELERLHAFITSAGTEATATLRDALERSVKLQSHYADLLNMHDGGERMKFDSADAWIARLRECDLGKAQQPEPTMYYLRNVSAGFLGNSPLFWAKDGCGYTQWIDDAHEFTIEEALKTMKGCQGSHVLQVHAVADVRAIARLTTDIQHYGLTLINPTRSEA